MSANKLVQRCHIVVRVRDSPKRLEEREFEESHMNQEYAATNAVDRIRIIIQIAKSRAKRDVVLVTTEVYLIASPDDSAVKISEFAGVYATPDGQSTAINHSRSAYSSVYTFEHRVDSYDPDTFYNIRFDGKYPCDEKPEDDTGYIAGTYIFSGISN